MKPATALPWKASVTKFASKNAKNYVTISNERMSICKMTASEDLQVADVPDAAYIVHACNAYPKLVEALRQCQQHLEARPSDTGLDVIRQRNSSILRELGELE